MPGPTVLPVIESAMGVVCIFAYQIWMPHTAPAQLGMGCVGAACTLQQGTLNVRMHPNTYWPLHTHCR